MREKRKKLAVSGNVRREVGNEKGKTHGAISRNKSPERKLRAWGLCSRYRPRACTRGSCSPQSRSMTKRTALITGITGQDGSYLAELLLAKGYVVYGMIRRASVFNIDRIEHLYQDPHASDYRLRLDYGNLTYGSRITQLLSEIKPDEIYNLGAQSHVQVSFEQPEYTGDVDAVGVTRLLEGVRVLGLKTRIYQACSSEM